MHFGKKIRESPLYFIDIPFNERLNFIIKHYGILNREEIINAILRIQKRLGPNETKTSINFILENNSNDLNLSFIVEKRN